MDENWSTSVQRQIEALKQLGSLYFAAKHKIPYVLSPDEIRRIVDGTATPQDRDPVSRHISWREKVRAAQKELLQSGFDVPNSWLAIETTDTIGIIPSVPSRQAERPPAIRIVEPLDRRPLEVAIREINAAILRLEATGDIEPKTKAEIRRQQIPDLYRQSQHAKQESIVAELRQRFAVSRATIMGDLKALRKAGKLPTTSRSAKTLTNQMHIFSSTRRDKV